MEVSGVMRKYEGERTLPFRISAFVHLAGEGGKEKRLASFDLIVSTAVEGCSYAEVRTNEQARSDASNATPCTYYVSAEFRLAVEFVLHHILSVSPPSTAQSRGKA